MAGVRFLNSAEHRPFLKPEIFEIGRRNTNQNPKTQELVSLIYYSFSFKKVDFEDF
jgi:hypothetical protein